MKKNEISEILSGLSSDDFIKLKEYFGSAYFGVDTRLKVLIEIIEKNYEGILSGRTNRDEIINSVFDSKPSEPSARKLISDFLKIIDNFYTQTEFESEINLRKIFTLRQLRKRNLVSRHTQKLNSALKNLREVTVPGSDVYRHGIDISNEIFASEPISEFHKYSASIQQKSDYLDYYYLNEKLHTFMLMFSKQYINRTDLNYRWEMWDEIEGFILRNTDKLKTGHTDIYIKYLMLKMLSFDHDSMELIGEYVECLNSVEQKVPKEQLIAYYSDLYNYFSIKIGMGETELRKPLFELYSSLDIKDLLCDGENGEISYYTFKQITDTCIHLKELDWLKGFIDKYSPVLKDVNRDNIISMAKAKMLYYYGDNKGARIQLMKVSQRDYIHYLDSRQLLACIAYDELNFDEVTNIMDSIRKYAKGRKDMTPAFWKSSLLFMEYLNALMKLADMTDKKEKKSEVEYTLKKLNAENENIYAMKWIEEKLITLIDSK